MSNQPVPGGVVHELPADLRKALIAKATVLDAWKDITPLARNEFICWVEEAKQEKTRKRRIRRTREELVAGLQAPRAHRQIRQVANATRVAGMAHEGQQIFNPRTGQRMTFVQLREELLQIDTVNPSNAAEREPGHVHPKQESGAEVVSGSLLFEVDGTQSRVGPGESISIPANTPHRFWNEGDEDAHSIQFFKPALDIASFFETLFALAQQDKLDSRGMPGPLQLALLIPEFEDELRPLSPPWPLLKALAALLGPLARARGYRGRVRSPLSQPAPAGRPGSAP